MNKQDFEIYADQKMFSYNVAPLWEYHFKKCVKKENKDLSSLKLLDYGCGDGKYYPYLIKYGLRSDNIYGVEVSKTRINRCKQLGWENVYYVEKGQSLPFKDNFFNVVNFMEVIEHIPVFDIEFSVKEIHRVISPSGIMMLSTPNYPIKRFYDLSDALLWNKWERLKDDPTHVTFYNHKKLNELLKKYFKNLSMMPYKTGFLFDRFEINCFMHKILAVCTHKR